MYYNSTLKCVFTYIIQKKSQKKWNSPVTSRKVVVNESDFPPRENVMDPFSIVPNEREGM
jgi:hypothetical protein